MRRDSTQCAVRASPRTFGSADALILAHHADAILLIVRTNRAPSSPKAIARLSAAAKPIGVIDSRMVSSLVAKGIYIRYARRTA